MWWPCPKKIVTRYSGHLLSRLAVSVHNTTKQLWLPTVWEIWVSHSFILMLFCKSCIIKCVNHELMHMFTGQPYIHSVSTSCLFMKFQLGYLLWIGCLLASLQLTDYYETLINLNTNYYKIVYQLHYKLLVLQYRLHYKSLQTCY